MSCCYSLDYGKTYSCEYTSHGIALREAQLDAATMHADNRPKCILIGRRVMSVEGYHITEAAKPTTPKGES